MIRGVKALKAAAKPQTTFLCLSSSNTVFIRTILEVLSLFAQFEILTSYYKAKGLRDLFTEIVTNPAEWDQSGLLKLRRHIDPNGPQHNCPIGCNANLCKGRFRVAHVRHARVTKAHFLQVKNSMRSSKVTIRTLIGSSTSEMARMIFVLLRDSEGIDRHARKATPR